MPGTSIPRQSLSGLHFFSNILKSCRGRQYFLFVFRWPDANDGRPPCLVQKKAIYNEKAPIDRDADNVPTLDAETGLPTAEVTGSPGFCTIEPVQDPDLGFEFLARFFVRATGNLAVTVRLKGVEQVFCTSEAGGEITFADLTAPDPQFEVISLEDVENLNPRVAKIIR